MSIEVISTNKAPAAVGPYSQAIKVQGLVFVSGQIALDPDTGTLVRDSIEAETERVMQNLRAILEAAGSSLDKVVKTTIYLTSIEDYAAVNKTYERFFASAKPARATVQVAALPKGAHVEIEAVAIAS